MGARTHRREASRVNRDKPRTEHEATRMQRLAFEFARRDLKNLPTAAVWTRDPARHRYPDPTRRGSFTGGVARGLDPQGFGPR